MPHDYFKDSDPDLHEHTSGGIAGTDKSRNTLAKRKGRGGQGLNISPKSPKPGAFEPCFMGRCRLRCHSCWRSLCVLQWPCKPAGTLLSLLPPTSAHILLCSRMLVLQTKFSLNKPSGSLLAFSFRAPIQDDLGSLIMQTSTQHPTSCPGCCYPNLKASSGQTHYPHPLSSPRFFWIYLFQDMTFGCCLWTRKQAFARHWIC